MRNVAVIGMGHVEVRQLLLLYLLMELLIIYTY